MDWLVLSYSLPSKSRSGPRVAFWRRLRRLGALSLAGGFQVLPAREECVEAFQWLAQEIRQSQGDALLMRVEQFEGRSDPELIEMFNQARQADYAGIEAEATKLEKRARARLEPAERSGLAGELAKLRKQQADVARVDYFNCPAGTRLAATLDRIEQTVSAKNATSVKVLATARDQYRDARWVTRPRPHVDRLACAWLIRRFINPKAVIRYAARPAPDEISFDMSNAQFGHRGNLCTFETMLRAFDLEQAALRAMAEIIHEIDLRDELYARPETEGIDAVLKGWLRAGLTDSEIETRGIALFEGLYNAFASEAHGMAKTARLAKKDSQSGRNKKR